MRLQELVEQHRIHGFITNRTRLALLVTSYWIGVFLFHFLSHEAELLDALRVKLVLVAEGSGMKSEDRFARLLYRLDRVFETLRRDDYAQTTIAIGIILLTKR
jgi:hypothetical protein